MGVLSNLLFTFMKIGAFTFGGGYAMISLIEKECVEKRNWITHDEFMNITAIAESTPGPLVIKCTAFTGYRQAGFIGSVIATIGIVFPSFLTIYLITLFFDNFLEIVIIANAFKGIKIAVGVIIMSVAIKMFQNMPKKMFPIIIMICSLAVSILINIFSLRISTIYLILFSGLTGYLYFIITNIRNKKIGEIK